MSTIRAPLLIIVMALASAAARADDQPSLDQLLDLPAPGQTQPAPEGGSAPARADADQLKNLTDEEAADLFQQALQEMDQAAGRLSAQLDPGVATQRIQESILAKLDQVLAAARKKGSSSSSSGGEGQPTPGEGEQQQDTGSAANQGQQPNGQQQAGGAQASAGENRGPGTPPGGAEQSRGGPMAQNRAEWGNLPPRLREQLQQGMSEKFSSVYQSITEAYYKRLAEKGGSE